MFFLALRVKNASSVIDKRLMENDGFLKIFEIADLHGTIREFNKTIKNLNETI